MLYVVVKAHLEPNVPSIPSAQLHRQQPAASQHTRRRCRSQAGCCHSSLPGAEDAEALLFHFPDIDEQHSAAAFTGPLPSSSLSALAAHARPGEGSMIGEDLSADVDAATGSPSLADLFEEMQQDGITSPLPASHSPLLGDWLEELQQPDRSALPSAGNSQDTPAAGSIGQLSRAGSDQREPQAEVSVQLQQGLRGHAARSFRVQQPGSGQGILIAAHHIHQGWRHVPQKIQQTRPAGIVLPRHTAGSALQGQWELINTDNMQAYGIVDLINTS